jgi:hypothetical protein
LQSSDQKTVWVSTFTGGNDSAEKTWLGRTPLRLFIQASFG